jgi:hypothetical protein
MFVEIVVECECGSKFEAHVAHGLGSSQNSLIAKCPDCGKPLNLPDPIVEPLIKLAA